MINPLHRKLPRVVLLLQTNSNRFTHNVLHQWLVLDTLCESILDPVLGPGIGHASVGDSRRRKLMHNQSVGVVDRYHHVPVDLGFIMSARIKVTAAGKRLLKDLYDQDCIHNDKKILNPLHHPTRILQLGKYSAHMNHLRLVMATFPPCTHGLHADDIARKDRQKWEVVQRLKFLSVQTCLVDIAHGNNGVTKDVSVWYVGIPLCHLALHRDFLQSACISSLENKVCCLCCYFLQLMAKLDRDFQCLLLTRECFQDVLLSCHYSDFLLSR